MHVFKESGHPLTKKGENSMYIGGGILTVIVVVLLILLVLR